MGVEVATRSVDVELRQRQRLGPAGPSPARGRSAGSSAKNLPSRSKSVASKAAMLAPSSRPTRWTRSGSRAVRITSAPSPCARRAVSSADARTAADHQDRLTGELGFATHAVHRRLAATAAFAPGCVPGSPLGGHGSRPKQDVGLPEGASHVEAKIHETPRASGGVRGARSNSWPTFAAGTSRVLVLRGEAGVGKTALLDVADRAGRGFRVARAVGVESEMELAYSGLHQLCGPMLESSDHLPPPQREALETVFGVGRRPAA